MNNSNRLVSVDVFRGFTIAAMILVNFPGSHFKSYGMLLHSSWNGATPTDFIFPFFIFIVGVSIVLSFSKQMEAEKPKSEMVRKIIVRSVKIYLIGMMIDYLPKFDFGHIDLFDVLQRIALVYLACSLLFLYSNWKQQLFIMAGILLIYWVTLSFVPTDEFSAGTMEPGMNFAAWFDRLIIPANLLGKHGWNSEGPYSTFPAIASGISGLLAGYLVYKRSISEKTIIWLITAGVISLLAGAFWNIQFPINKRLWTSSYVLYTSGWAAIVLGLTLWLVDLKNYKNNILAHTGVIFGMNAIAIYIIASVFETFYLYTHLHDWVYFGLTDGSISEKNASLIWALISVSSCWIVAYLLYRRKIFIKI